MNDEAGASSSSAAAAAAGWSLGLTRSYSEHAALVLQHYQQHRRRQEPLKYTRSGPEFRNVERADSHSEADDEDEDEEERQRNEGQRTWRIPSSESEDGEDNRKKMVVRHLGGGDTRGLMGEFSDLSLDSEVCEGKTSSQTMTSMERRCRLFDDEDDEDDAFTIVDDEENEEKYSDYPVHDDRGAQSERNEPRTTACVVSSSTCSLSTMSSRQRINGMPVQRQISYEIWARDKQRELQRRKDEERRAEQKKRELEENEKRKREEKERREYECFVEWMERKKREKMLKKELMEKELDLQKRIQDVEDKAVLAKNICLSQWHRKKEEQMKASEKQELMKKKKAEEEKQRRLQESMKAYEKWREKAKNTPRPATQGLLPHQKAKPAFTNPTPWQPIVDNVSDDSDEGNQAKTPRVPIKGQRNKRTYVKR